jgi:hypothetical protein
MKTKIGIAGIALLTLMACGSDTSKQEEQTATAESAPGTKFILKASNNQYVTMNGGMTLNANEASAAKAEVFEKIDIGNGHYNIKASNGKFICDDRSKNDSVYANRDTPGDWETFEMISTDQTSVRIKAVSGKFISNDPEKGYVLIANKDNADTQETFKIEEVK